MLLKDTMLRTAKPADKPYKLPRELGLFLLVNPNGARLWRFAYTFEGREKLLSLGAYPDVPLKLARERRDEARRLLATGVDPSADRQAAYARREIEATNTFKAVAGEWLAMKADSFSAGTHNKARWMLEFAYPHIGAKPLGSIQPPDILEALRTLERTGKLETMHRLKARISEVFRFAIATGRATSDPCRDLRGALKPKRPTKHFAAITDPKGLAALLRGIEGYTGTMEVRAALRLAPRKPSPTSARGSSAGRAAIPSSPTGPRRTSARR